MYCIENELNSLWITFVIYDKTLQSAGNEEMSYFVDKKVMESLSKGCKV